MISSPNDRKDLIFSLYQDARTVYKLIDIAMILGESNFESLNKKLNSH